MVTCLAGVRNGQIITAGARKARVTRLGDGFSVAVDGVEREGRKGLALTFADPGSHLSRGMMPSASGVCRLHLVSGQRVDYGRTGRRQKDP